MPTPILMPALSPTMTEGNLAKWLKSEGDAIKSGDVIAEIETDKATMEVEAVDEGVLGRILVQAGTEGVKVNDPIEQVRRRLLTSWKLSEDELKVIDGRVREIVNEAAEFATHDPEPDPSELWTDILL